MKKIYLVLIIIASSIVILVGLYFKEIQYYCFQVKQIMGGYYYRYLGDVNIVWIFLVIVFIVFVVGLVIFFKRRKGTIIPPQLGGRLLYGVRRLRFSVLLEGRDPMCFSVGDRPLSSIHIQSKTGTTFRFAISPIKSSDGNTFINLKCEPPGLFRQDGEIKTETNLFGGDRFVMNGITFKYETNQYTQKGSSISEKREESDEII